MLVHGFDMHRIYLSAPGDLEVDRDLCRDAIAKANEAIAMREKILLVAVGLPNEGLVEQYRSAVADNIRQCRYYIQLFQDDWGPRHLVRKMFYVALDSRGKPDQLMHEVLVLLKDAPREIDPEILAFRKELAELPGVEVLRYQDPADLAALLEPVLSRWVEQIQKEALAPTKG